MFPVSSFPSALLSISFFSTSLLLESLLGLVYTCFDLTDAEDIEKLKNINIDAAENNYGVKYLPENIITHCLHIHYNHYEKAIEFLEKEMNKYGYFEFKPSDDMTCIDAVWKTDGHTFAIFYLEQILKILSEEENESV